jgi:hypothetical protein
VQHTCNRVSGRATTPGHDQAPNQS